MIERHHLAILKHIDELGSMTAASQAMNLTQSALSHTVRKFEEQIGTPLWQRTGRRMELTQAGHYLLAVAKRLLPQLEHADQVVRDMARGEKGQLRIGMECYPCYQWLLSIVTPYLRQWPEVDVDVKQKFQFGGMAALYSYDIDILVTPDPLDKAGVRFVPVFDYEQVLVISDQSALTKRDWIRPEDLQQQTLLAYPVDRERLDVYSQFLTPAQCLPARHKSVEDTDIMLQLVAADRGVCALPKWLVQQVQRTLPLQWRPLGQDGIHKQIHLGFREGEDGLDYVDAFLQLALTDPSMMTEKPAIVT
ncbi:LysR family transcriptional regulator [Reinekea blandensis]|uniref:HTH-type transcriptional regulator MetR n=1 Tax=Reinekea blandensis MED297 TaxID=314283 RepID=A4BB75_9GAMM|nr:LysR family transcriptional regulator [Reinekea blandensis]EAR10688.1 transcriptional regulator, LysR family protein [Reinekea sp. MED297] [Reinekea blandensis MED297]